MKDQMGKQAIIITGSNGFLGRAIGKRLSSRFKVIGLDHKVTKNSEEIECHEVDISSAESIGRALDAVREGHGDKIASVIHLAAFYSFTEKESPLYDQITVKGTRHLLEALKEFEVQQFIFSSTMLVHRPGNIGEPINENSPLDPAWAYPLSKVDAETELKRQHDKIPLVNLRIAGVYDDGCHSIPISNQIMRVYEKQLSSRLYPGDTDKGQAFIHLDDLVDAVEKIVGKREALPAEIDLLLGEPKVVSYREMQNMAGALLHGAEWSCLKIPAWFAKTGAWLQHHTPFIRRPFILPWMIDFANDHYELDISRARSLLQWRPKHQLRESVPIMIAELKKDPLRWYVENKLPWPPAWTRFFGRMPGDDKGLETPSRLYVHQVNALNLLNILWGVWLIFDGLSYVTGDSMLMSSLICGLLVIVFSAMSLWLLWQWPRWLAALAGLWVLFAPLAFWEGSPAAYSAGNLLGFLIITCGALRPSKNYFSVPAAMDAPPGWDYNPSTWQQRVPIIALALLGFFIARYMAAFQLGHTSEVWDPVFAGQTEAILKSDVSKAFVVSDAGLGAFSYLLDAISGLIGDRHRWRTMPWMVILFGIMIIPPGVTSIALVILQPVAVNAWCFLCLVTAVIMLMMVAPALDEVVATVQFLRRSRKEGKPFWRTFFHGEAFASEEIMDLLEREVKLPLTRKKGPSIPWALVGSILVGAGLMFSPALLAMARPASSLVYFASALILTFAIIALSEIARPVRFLNMVVSAILIIGIWTLEGAALETKGIVSVAACAVWALSFPRGKFRKHFGNYDRLARWTPFRNVRPLGKI